MKSRLLITMLFCICLASAPGAWGANSVVAVPAGQGVWVLQGADIASVAGMDIRLSYDASLLGNPAVTQGSLIGGALMVANTNVSGQIHIAVVTTSAISGSGPIATVSFGRGTGPGGITGVTAKFIDSRMADVPAQGAVAADSSTAAAGGGSSTQVSQVTGQTVPSSSSTPGGQVVGGSVTIPGSPFKEEPKALEPVRPAETLPPVETQVVPARENPPVAPRETPVVQPGDVAAVSGEKKGEKVSEQPKKEELGAVHFPSVADRFRTYAGERSLAAMEELFAGQSEIYRQEPRVVVADGTATVTLRLRLSEESGAAPNFALVGAELVSLKSKGGEWLVEAMPGKGMMAASVFVISNDSTMEIPLATTPPADILLSKGAAPSEADFKLFLKERGTEEKPLHDLNNDGRRDYLDEYIFVANYLASRQVKKLPGKTPAK